MAPKSFSNQPKKGGKATKRVHRGLYKRMIKFTRHLGWDKEVGAQLHNMYQHQHAHPPDSGCDCVAAALLDLRLTSTMSS